MAITIVNSTDITITATGEDLTFAKIRSQINSLSDANNYCSGTICRLNKKLILTGNQALNLGTDNHILFIGLAKHLQISSTFTSVTNGTIIDGVRSGITTLAHWGNATVAQQNILNNTVETHLRLRITTNSSSTHPRLTVQNTHADSTLEMWVSSAEEGDNTSENVYFRGGWAGENTVIFEKGAYQASYLNNWFNITEARENSALGFKTLPETAYPTAGYKYGGSRGQFGSINANARLDNLVGAIGIGTSNYIYHPAFSNRKIFFRYDFGFDFTGADLTNAKLGFISGSTLFQTETMTGNQFDVDEVVLLKGDTRNGPGGISGYSQLQFEEFDYKTGSVRIRKNGVVEQDIAYDKIGGVASFDISGNFVADDNWSNTGVITVFTNLDELYDKLQDWLVANLTTDTFVSKDEVALDLAGYSLVVDKTAGTLLDVNTTTDTVTIKADTLGAGTKFTSLISTATVTTANGAEINVPIQDANGDSSVPFGSVTNIQSWRLYPTIADADAGTNEIANDTTAPIDDYRFNYSTNQDWFAKIVTTTDIVYPKVEIRGTGEAELIYSQTALLTQINTSTKDINDQVKHIDSFVFLDTASGTNGDGSREEPFNTYAGALAQAVSSNRSIKCYSSVTLTASTQGVNIVGTKHELELDVNGQDITDSVITDMEITGACVGDFVAKDCHFHDATGIEGHHLRCGLNGDCSATGVSQFINCWSSVAGLGRPILRVTGTGTQLKLEDWKGGLDLRDSADAGNNTTFSSNGGRLKLTNNTLGTISLRGGFYLEDDNAGATVETTVFIATDILKAQQKNQLTEISKVSNP